MKPEESRSLVEGAKALNSDEKKQKTREEEIIEAGIEYTMSTSPNVICGDAFAEDDLVRQLNRNKHFEAGAKWSDKHPINYDGKAFLYVNQKSSKLAYKAALEDVCEYIEQYAPIDTMTKCDNFIAELKEAMKEKWGLE